MAGYVESKFPMLKNTSNITSYFSGHYQCYRLNVQATCDLCCHFTLVSVLCPGGTGDSKAFSGSTLYDFIQGLPAGFYMIADNAYTLSEHLLIPYSGTDKKDKSKDAYNFYISQLCI